MSKKMLDVFDPFAHLVFISDECVSVNGHGFLRQKNVEDISISSFKKKYNIQSSDYFYMSFSKVKGYTLLPYHTQYPQKIMFLNTDWVFNHHPFYLNQVMLSKPSVCVPFRFHPVIEHVNWMMSSNYKNAKYYVREVGKKRHLKPQEWRANIHPSGRWQVTIKMLQKTDTYETISKVHGFTANTTLQDFLQEISWVTTCEYFQNRFFEGLIYNGVNDGYTLFDLLTGS